MAETDRTVDDGSMLGASSRKLPPELLCTTNLSLLLESLESSHGSAGNSSLLTDLYPDISKLLDAPSLRGGGSSIESTSFNTCPTEWDNLVCWPETIEGQTVTLPCFSVLNNIYYDTSRNATRYCMEGGNWTKSDYNDCRPLPNGMTGSNEGGNLAITTGVYFFGYCVSLCALVIAIIIFLVFKELRCLRNTIHTHLMITYILADTLWIITSSTTITSTGNVGMGSTGSADNQTIGSSMSGAGQNNQVPCVTFILLHYFHMTNFFWMFVEGLYLYVLVVLTFVSGNIKLRVYASIGWGVPLLVVIAWSIAKWMTQSDSAESHVSDAEYSSTSCLWLHVNEYDWIYKTPVILVLAANILFLLQIMWVLITKLRSAMNPETQQSVKAAKALVVLMPLLGITYVLVLSGSKAPVYEYSRALLISSQGFLVALLYCFLNGEVRMAIRHRWNRLRLMGPVHDCCDFDRRRQMHMRDWSPRSRTESIRYSCATQHDFRKRDSTISEATTMTTINSGPGSTPSGSCGYGYSVQQSSTGSGPLLQLNPPSHPPARMIKMMNLMKKDKSTTNDMSITKNGHGTSLSSIMDDESNQFSSVDLKY
ncbi:unnamed protein product [Orchesella dallaii]